jgi:hypothetical protein
MTIKMPHSVRPASDDKKAEEFIAGATLKSAPAPQMHVIPAPRAEEAGKTTISLRFDSRMLSRVDAAARGQGISRTAWLHVAASKALE